MHSDYATWLGHWYRDFYAIAIPLVVIETTSDYLWLLKGGVFLVIAGIVSLLVFLIMFYQIDLVLRRTTRKYRQQWDEQHNRTPSANEQSN